MEKPLEDSRSEESFFISAVHQEMFNRIFPHLRHDLVGGLSASLMRVTIMDRHLNKTDFETSRVNAELKKIEGHLKETIVGIRELQFWDFDVVHRDTLCNILQRSVRLMASHLLLKNIQLNVQPCEIAEESSPNTIETKPLLYTLLCIFSFVEDHDYTNRRLDIIELTDAVEIRIASIAAQDASPYTKNRHLIITREFATKFALHHNIQVEFNDEKISLKWQPRE